MGAVKYYREDCFAYRGKENKREFCSALDVNDCRKCKFYKTYEKYIADLLKAQERVNRINEARKCE